MNQSFNYINNNNGSEYDNWLGPVAGIVGGPYGKPFAPGWSLFYGGTGDYVLSARTVNWPNNDAQLGLATIYGRNTVINFHIGIPHQNDAGRDDIQLLYDDEALKNQVLHRRQRLRLAVLHGPGRSFRTGVHVRVNGETLSTLTGGGVPFGTSVPVTFTNTYTWGCGSSVGKTFSSAALNGLAELRASPTAFRTA